MTACLPHGGGCLGGRGIPPVAGENCAQQYISKWSVAGAGPCSYIKKETEVEREVEITYAAI